MSLGEAAVVVLLATLAVLWGSRQARNLWQAHKERQATREQGMRYWLGQIDKGGW